MLPTVIVIAMDGCNTARCRREYVHCNTGSFDQIFPVEYEERGIVGICSANDGAPADGEGYFSIGGVCIALCIRVGEYFVEVSHSHVDLHNILFLWGVCIIVG